MDLIDILRTFHPNAKKYTFLKYTWNILQDRPQDVVYPVECKLKKIETVSSIFSDHNALKLDINYREKKKKNLQKTQTHGD